MQADHSLYWSQSQTQLQLPETLSGIYRPSFVEKIKVKLSKFTENSLGEFFCTRMYYTLPYYAKLHQRAPQTRAKVSLRLFVCLDGVLCRYQHLIGHISTVSPPNQLS